MKLNSTLLLACTFFMHSQQGYTSTFTDAQTETHILSTAAQEAGLSLQHPDFFNKSVFKEKQRVDAQIAFFDAIYEQYPIADNNDFLNKIIPHYIDFARVGLNYIRHHYGHTVYTTVTPLTEEQRDLILNRCQTLEEELNIFASKSTGMTPVQFLCYNNKLALLQELEMEQDILETLGLWDSQLDVPRGTHTLNSLLEIPFTDEDTWLFNFTESGGIRNEWFTLHPYVIYTPTGAFSIQRLAEHMIFPEHHHSMLLGLPIGPLAPENAPHVDEFLKPLSFFNHDLFHSVNFRGHNFYTTNTSCRFSDFLQQQAKMPLDLKDPIVSTALFFVYHENKQQIEDKLFIASSSCQSEDCLDSPPIASSYRSTTNSLYSTFIASLDPSTPIQRGEDLTPENVVLLKAFAKDDHVLPSDYPDYVEQKKKAFCDKYDLSDPRMLDRLLPHQYRWYTMVFHEFLLEELGKRVQNKVQKTALEYNY